MDAPFTGADVEATRKASKPKISRDKFAQLVGLTPTKIYNIEKGRPMTPEEVAALTPHVIPGAAGQAAPPSEPPAPQPPTNPTPDIHALSEDELVDPILEPGDVVVCGEDPGDPNCVTCLCGHVAATPNKLRSHTGDLAPEPAPEPVVAEPEISVSSGPEQAPAEPAFEFPPNSFAATNSELRAFKNCRRHWWLAFYRRLGLPVPELVGVRNLGTWVHGGLEALYAPPGVDPRDPMVRLEEIIQEDLLKLQASNPLPDQLDAFTKQADLARIMMEGYIEWLAETGADQFIEIVAPETRVIVPLDMTGPQGEVIFIMGKLDVRVRRTTDGVRMFIDHKTVGDLKTPTRVLHMDEQMMHYHLLEWLDMLRSQVPGERADGGLYNMLRKVKRTARATPPFYDRVEVRFNQPTMDSYYLRVVGEITDILETRKKLNEGADPRMVAYPNPTKDCTWKCDFFHICPMFDDGSRVEDYIAENLVTIDPHARYDDATVADTES